MRRLEQIAVLFLLVLLVSLSAPHPVGSQQVVQIEARPAVGHFPEEILFPVVAESTAADIASLELSYRVVGEAYTRSRWPELDSARKVDLSYRMDTQVDHYPPGTEFHYYWTATDAAGNVIDSEEQVFVYQDDRFDWYTLSTERVAVYWYMGEDSFGQELLDTAVRALDRLEREAGVQAKRQISIHVYGQGSDFRGALGPNSPEWIGGQAMPPLALIIAYIRPSDPEYREIRRMIPHELSHVVLYQATSNPYTANPNWLEEGIAVHNQEVADAEFPFLVEEAALEGRLIPLRALAASFPSDPDLAILSYAESVSIVEFILEQYGEEGLSALVDVFAEGETSEVAVQRALGVSLDDLEAQWWATLPAPVRTPVPGATAAPREEPLTGFNIEALLLVVGSALACTFFLAVTVVVVVVVVVRRRRAADAEDVDTEGYSS